MLRLIFEESRKGCHTRAQWPSTNNQDDILRDIPEELVRKDIPNLPEVSELQTVRHYTNLSKKNWFG